MGSIFSKPRDGREKVTPGSGSVSKIGESRSPKPGPSEGVTIPPRTSKEESLTPIKSGSGSNPSHLRSSWDDLLSAVEDETLRNDPDLAEFDDGMKQRTEKVLDSLEEGINSGGLELSSLKDVTSGLIDMDEEVAKIILDCDLDLWANDEMKELVAQYFDHSLRTLNFFDHLEKSVQKAQDSLMMYIGSAIKYIPVGRDPTEEECQQVLLLLELFTKDDNPFSSEFSKLFCEVDAQQRQLQVKLADQKRRTHRKDRNIGMVRKVTTVILTATCVSMVICAAVAMAVAAPMVGNLSASAAASLPFETMHGWLRSLWKKYEHRVKVRREFIDVASLSIWVTIKDLDTINVEVSRLNGEVDGILRNIRFGQERGDALAVQQTVKVIQRKQENFGQQLGELKSHISDCVRRINRFRDLVLERILGDPARESHKGTHVRQPST